MRRRAVIRPGERWESGRGGGSRASPKADPSAVVGAWPRVFTAKHDPGTAHCARVDARRTGKRCYFGPRPKKLALCVCKLQNSRLPRLQNATAHSL